MTKKEKLKAYEESVSVLQDLLDVQCTDGNWNHDAYMHGLANGLILAMSVFGDRTPQFLEAPSEWVAVTKENSKVKEPQCSIDS